MENLTPWKTIKIGFLLGVGFTIPLLVTDALVMGLSFGAATSAFEKMEVETTDYEELSDGDNEPYPTFSDLSDKIDLGHHTTRMQGKQLLIVGQLTNGASETVKTIEIEAELFDASGAFVYECSEYISTQLLPNQEENYQIKCGCSENGLPEFATLKLKVQRAVSY